jgi:ribosomal-protein-alanine N-acetyltransferase
MLARSDPPPPLRVLRTERLELVAVDHALAVAQIEDRMGFFAALSVRPTAAWPPPLLDMEAMSFTRDRVANFPAEVGWQAWVWIDPDVAPGALRELVGFGGFTAAPDPNGWVEIGYSVLPARQGRGYATEAVSALVAWGRRDPRLAGVCAHTMVDGFASQNVLKKLGFALAPNRPYPDVLRWELRIAPA